MGIRDISWAVAKIVEHEGFRLNPYTDHLGYITGGVGHKFTKYDFEHYRKDWSREEKTKYWGARFEEDLSRSEEAALRLADVYGIELTDKILYVLTDMAFNLGPAGLAGFRNFLAALARGDIDSAIEEMKYERKGSETHSKWYRQVPNRVDSLIQILRSSNESS